MAVGAVAPTDDRGVPHCRPQVDVRQDLRMPPIYVLLYLPRPVKGNWRITWACSRCLANCGSHNLALRGTSPTADVPSPNSSHFSESKATSPAYWFCRCLKYPSRNSQPSFRSAQRQYVAAPLPNSRQRPTFGGERYCSPLVGATLTACPLDDRIKAHDVSRSSATRRGHPPRSSLALEIPGERLLRLQCRERETIPPAAVACHYGSQATDAVRTGARVPYQPTG